MNWAEGTLQVYSTQSHEGNVSVGKSMADAEVMQTHFCPTCPGNGGK